MCLRSWIRRFKGVATRYLPNYLTWHRFIYALETVATRHGVGCRRLLMVEFP